MYRYRSREIGNRPTLYIEGQTIEHVLSSPHFSGCFEGFNIICDNGAVKMVKKGTNDQGMVIGWMEEIEE